ncbi:MAG: hypothetical protein EBT42_05705 [Actinobacteria bacterium]|nr:hypothetical protein [Actinomycetota bacterium]
MWRCFGTATLSFQGCFGTVALLFLSDILTRAENGYEMSYQISYQISPESRPNHAQILIVLFDTLEFSR